MIIFHAFCAQALIKNINVNLAALFLKGQLRVEVVIK
jgi:hypothetical protein